MDLSEVRVHANSNKPGWLGALAYAQGNDIHLGHGREQSLPHEAWHVIQQQQGWARSVDIRVKDVAVNNDPRLESEADTIGARATDWRGAA